MLYLVGSRFYGTHRPDSDYDFIGEDNLANHQLCKELGLARLDSPKVRYAGNGYDVCLYREVWKYVSARDTLKAKYPTHTMTKDERHEKLLEVLDALAI